MYDRSIIHFDPHFLDYSTYLLFGKRAHTSSHCIKQPKSDKSCRVPFSVLQSICFCPPYHCIFQIVFNKHRSNACAPKSYLIQEYGFSLGSCVYIKAGGLWITIWSYGWISMKREREEFYGMTEKAAVWLKLKVTAVCEVVAFKNSIWLNFNFQNHLLFFFFLTGQLLCEIR